MSKKTHREVKAPRLSVSRLADYMDASEQSKRTILRTCKYQPIARVVQYNEAKSIIAEWLRGENRAVATLQEKLERMKAKVLDDPFDEKVNEHNCDCIERFITVADEIDLPKATLLAPRKLPHLVLNGTTVSFQSDILVSRVTRTNKIRIGAGMIRYQKGKPVPEGVAQHQAAFMHGYLEQRPFEEQAEAEKGLCVVIDAHSGKVHPAPGNSVYLFNEIEAVCAGIAERWGAIAPPNGAVL